MLDLQPTVMTPEAATKQGQISFVRKELLLATLTWYAAILGAARVVRRTAADGLALLHMAVGTYAAGIRGAGTNT